jgi:hypothetical protein
MRFQLTELWRAQYGLRRRIGNFANDCPPTTAGIDNILNRLSVFHEEEAAVADPPGTPQLLTQLELAFQDGQRPWTRQPVFRRSRRVWEFCGT